jgi:Plavaka transposase
LDHIDNLPEGVKWKCEELHVTGDEPDLEADMSGQTMRSEMLEFWYRDPVECVRELIGKPAFDGYLKYAPERHFADEAEEVEVINEMWTAKWWWKIQVSNVEYKRN